MKEDLATMLDTRVLLDAFAEARRSWDDLIGLQPDIKAGAGSLTPDDLAELATRVGAHQSAMDVLADALQTGRAGAVRESNG